MKRIAFITALAAALAACTPSGVDIDVETERFSLNISSEDIDNELRVGMLDDYDEYRYGADTTLYHGTIPNLAERLATLFTFTNPYYNKEAWHKHLYGDSTMATMYLVDQRKQSFLPRYSYRIINRDTTAPLDFTPLLQALIDRQLLRADTAYEPLLLLTLTDTARYREALADTTVWSQTQVMVNYLRSDSHLPVVLDPALSFEQGVLLQFDGDYHIDTASLGLQGLSLVPDPRGRQMRIVTFNRHKGKI